MTVHNVRYKLNDAGNPGEYGLESPILCDNQILLYGEIIDILNEQDHAIKELGESAELLLRLNKQVVKRDWLKENFEMDLENIKEVGQLINELYLLYPETRIFIEENGELYDIRLEVKEHQCIIKKKCMNKE